MKDIAAISFDFFQTLAYSRDGRGRGAQLLEYFAAQGWESDQWDSKILYDVFELHGREYAPLASAEQHEHFCHRVATALFQRMNVRATPAAARAHAAELWNILGPDHLVLYPDVEPTLRQLKLAGVPMMVVSNWACGLGGFCEKLGISPAVDHVLASAEVKSAKPDRGIFDEACTRLGLDARRVLHVGDSVVDDWEGARNAGLQALLLERDQTANGSGARTISDLRQILDLLETQP